MEKIINIDGKDMNMAANGATPLVYRTIFGSDVFSDLQTAVEGESLKDPSVIERLAYVMGRQGGSIEKETSLEDWLGTIDDPMALIMAAGDIMTLWAGNRKTLSTSKKKNAR